MQKYFLLLIYFFITLFSFQQIYANPFLSTTENINPQENAEEHDAQNKIISPVAASQTSEKNKEKQIELRQKIADSLVTWQSKSSKQQTEIIFAIISISFLYGIIHALGPGHRKTIVFSLYLTRKCAWWEPIFTSIFLAILHGGFAIFLMLIFKGVAGSISLKTESFSIYLEGFSYGIIILTSLFLLICETITFLKTKNSQKIFSKQESSKKKLIPFLISGAYPCPGAVLILILSFTSGILKIGIIAVISMSLGMAIPILIAAYLAYFGRSGLFSILRKNESKTLIVSFAVECLGYIILIIFSVIISYPFFISLFSLI